MDRDLELLSDEEMEDLLNDVLVFDPNFARELAYILYGE